MKPRAKQINEILVRKGHAVHKTAKRPSRQALHKHYIAEMQGCKRVDLYPKSGYNTPIN